MRTSSLTDLVKRARGEIPPGLLLCFDPGETTGWATFSNANLEDCGQFRVKSQLDFIRLIKRINPHHLVVENYRVYKHKLAQHAGSEVPTIRYIGAIELAAEMLNIPLTFQMAWQGKGFATDTRLQAMGIFQPNKRHANDAIRHGVYWYVFHRGRKKPA